MYEYIYLIAIAFVVRKKSNKSRKHPLDQCSNAAILRNWPAHLHLSSRENVRGNVSSVPKTKSMTKKNWKRKEKETARIKTLFCNQWLPSLKCQRFVKKWCLWKYQKSKGIKNNSCIKLWAPKIPSALSLSPWEKSAPWLLLWVPRIKWGGENKESTREFKK